MANSTDIDGSKPVLGREPEPPTAVVLNTEGAAAAKAACVTTEASTGAARRSEVPSTALQRAESVAQSGLEETTVGTTRSASPETAGVLSETGVTVVPVF